MNVDNAEVMSNIQLEALLANGPNLGCMARTPQSGHWVLE